MEQELEKLKRIGRVEVSPFLFARIRHQIQTGNDAPLLWKLAFATASLAILTLNVGVALKSPQMNRENRLASVISAMHLAPSNNLYNE